ncbi:MAG: hypothetical protein EOP14_03720 [Pseudomonas sp.]|nr:MAG: hypothetical protein EOP14_03720 [Pseudomonas sp.]
MEGFDRRFKTVKSLREALQAAGLICCARGRIELVDRQGLEDGACESHGVVAREYRHLLG